MPKPSRRLKMKPKEETPPVESLAAVPLEALAVAPSLDEREVVPDPFGEIKYTGDREVDSKEEMSALLKGFKQRAAEENKRFRDATDSEYWCCLCFQSREQKEAFLLAMKWLQHGDKYLDGVALAEQQGIPMPESDLRFLKNKRDKLLEPLMMALED